jgi:broad specificity phosphatase PhoE
VRVLFKLPPENEHWFIMNNAAITRIDFHPDRVEVVYVNRVDFLPSELVT